MTKKLYSRKLDRNLWQHQCILGKMKTIHVTSFYYVKDQKKKKKSLNSKVRVYDHLQVFKHYLEFYSNIFQKLSTLEVLG